MIITRLKGGLGNQMFQFAMGYSLAKQSNTKLVLDTVSGFVRDRVFKRSFSLHMLGATDFIKASAFDRFLFRWVSRFPALLLFFKRPRLSNLYGNPDSDFIFQGYLSSDIRLDGYWHFAGNCKEYQENLFEIFSSTLALNDALIEKLGIDPAKDIALCMRFFEEIPGVDQHNMATETGFYQKALASVYTKGEQKLIVFSSDSIRAKTCLDGMGIGEDEYKLLTGDLGYADEIEILALMSYFTKLIISNSSFYWWAGWLAGMRNRQTIVIAPEIKGKNGYYPEHWKLL